MAGRDLGGPDGAPAGFCANPLPTANKQNAKANNHWRGYDL